MREKIAKWFFTDYSQVELGLYSSVWGEYENLPEADKESWRAKADRFLLFLSGEAKESKMPGVSDYEDFLSKL